jgi:hypothetical protein
MGHPILLPAGLALLAACASGRGESPRPLEIPSSPARLEHGDEIVAILNGEPLPWRLVAEKMLELDLKSAVDQYVRWRLVEDRRRTLGIDHTPDELRRRAEVYARQMRQQMGEEAFRAQMEREGTTLEAWISRLAGSRFLSDLLTLDKILRYNSLLEDQLETDRLVFVEEGEAATFVEAARTKGFDRAAEELEKGERRPTLGRLPREIFGPATPPANPILDDWIVEALLKLKPGEFTGVEHSRSNLHYVVLLRNLRKGRGVRYDEVKGEVLEGILADPPANPEYRRWIDRELAKCRVEYGERKPAPGGR